ncbi:hypothetical protein ICN41_10795 [Polynucleobacter sp. 15G-AUS-farblos]|nr:hypothetical protein [Polynucleobacter sp. 15G-AUS-farblos]
MKYVISLLMLFTLALGGCTAAKLEARLEADPQCKPIINPKTGSLMPCPGTDKGFYASVGLTSNKGDIKPNPPEDTKVQESGIRNMATPINPVPASSTSSQNLSSPGCKPQLHKKTGTALPCPAD